MSSQETAALASPQQCGRAGFQLRAQIFRQLQPIVDCAFSDSPLVIVQLRLPAIGQVESPNRL